ncbi:MAG: tRNA (N6-isopentenyl adenosine(37)-C2)-methylthiotransferase MiaB [Desulfobacteraceae bacterium]|nr:tRNA (N6-isopentenyl adenosine(37)-C2)-methylthiotransferase MiaB [Desulfobacteraceae bacterium]
MSDPLRDPAEFPRRLYVRTFGCQMNEYDSLRVQRLLAPLGYVTVDEIEDADVIFLNTCSVREKAEQKVHSFLGRLRRLKNRRPHLKIIAGGCVAQQLGEKLLSRFEHLDIVLGTRGIGSIARLLEEVLEGGPRVACLPEADPSLAPGEEAFAEGNISAPVTIMQGCNNYCTYCIVPYVRGPERSRPVGEILREIRSLEDSGVREILLLGQNVNSYGRGLKDRATFVDLLRLIARETGVQRVRFTTSHPKDLTEDLMLCFAELGVLCKHLHLPVQSGSDRILSAMNRCYTAGDYLGKIRRLRAICPEIALTSDVIVGFPGESEEDFTGTMDLLREVRFDNLFSFRYSDRPNTRASAFPDKVDPAIGTRRLVELQSFQAEITLEKNLAETGLFREVLVEGPSKASNGQMTGRTTQNRIVNFEAPEWTSGKIVTVKITGAYSHSLRGSVILGPSTRPGNPITP